MSKKILIILMLLFVQIAVAFPYFLNKQGILRNVTDGSLITGSYNFNVTLYNNSDNNPVYSENLTLSVSNGVYNYIIGYSVALVPTIFKEDDLYVIVKINDDVTSSTNLTTAPYAFLSLYCNDSDYLGGVNASSYATESYVDTQDTLVRESVDDNATFLDDKINRTNATTRRYIDSQDIHYNETMINHTNETYVPYIGAYQDVDLKGNNLYADEVNGSGLNISNDAYIGGNLGIGTISPNTQLVVVGGVNITGGLNISNGLNIIDGNVGIGTTSPTHTLTVSGDLNVTGTSYLGDTVINADNITVSDIVAKDENISFFNASKDEKMRITYDGKVGIGTSNPTESLTVVGNVNISGMLNATDIFANTIYQSGSSLDTLYVSRDAWTDIDDYPSACSSGEYATQLGDTLTCSVPEGLGNTTEEIQDSAWDVTGGTQTRITVTYQDSTDDVDFVVDDMINTSEQMQDSVGKIFGEGLIYDDAGNSMTFDCSEATDSAGDNLECSGENLVVSDSYIKLVGDTTGALDEDLNIDDGTFVIDYDGNKVGIGTTSPTHLLTVAGDLNVTGTSYLGDIIISADNLTVGEIIALNENISFFNASKDEKVRITYDGKVGIGTSNPTSELTVIGDIKTNNIITYNISSPYVNKSYITFFTDGSVGITLDPIIPLVSAQESRPESPETITYTPSSETHCNQEGKCWVALYSGVRFAQDKDSNWVNPSELLKITKNSDDLIFSYSGIEGEYNITFETGVIYNGNYYSMYDVKQLKPEIQFNFPTKKYPATRKYAVNITDIPTAMQDKIANITLTYKSHSGFTLSQLKSEKGKYLIKDVFELVFNDLIESDFIVKVNKPEKRIYIGNLTDKFVGNSLYLDPTIKLQEANTKNMDDTEVVGDEADKAHGAVTLLYVNSITTHIYRIYIKFNISVIPYGQQIDNATLYLYKSGGSLEGNMGLINVHHVYNHSWLEGDTADNTGYPNATWNSQPCGINFDQASECNLTAEDGYDPIAGEDNIWRNWSVTDAVRKEYGEGDLNISFVLKDSDEDDAINPYVSFYSKEYTTDTTLRPYLNITYQIAKKGVTSTLVAPADGSTDEDGDVIFNCSATAIVSILKNISLYHNISGTWLLNATNNVSGTSNTTNFTINDIPETTFAWNCLATNNATNQSFASANYTLTVLFPVPIKTSQFYVANTSGDKQWYVDFVGNMWLVGYINTTEICLNNSCILDWSYVNQTEEEIQDSVGKIFGEGLIYDDAGNSMTFDCSEATDSAGDNLECSGENLVVSDSYIKLVGDTTGALDEDLNIDDGTLVIDYNDNKIGIGTTSPTHLLTVAGDLNVTGTSYLGDIIISADNLTVGEIIALNENISFFNASKDEKVRITYDGKVGIGTTSPTEKLTIIGNIRASYFCNSSGSCFTPTELNTTIPLASDWNKANNDTANWLTLYGTNGFDKENMTIAYTSLDINTADDWNYANNASTYYDLIKASIITNITELNSTTKDYISQTNSTMYDLVKVFNTSTYAYVDSVASNVPLASDWNKANNDTPNWLTLYGTNGWDYENSTSFYDGHTDRFKLENITDKNIKVAEVNITGKALIQDDVNFTKNTYESGNKTHTSPDGADSVIWYWEGGDYILRRV